MLAICPQRELLKKQYVDAVNAFGQVLRDGPGRPKDRPEMRRLTQSASEVCQSALKAFVDHLAEHGCNHEEQTSLPSR